MSFWQWLLSIFTRPTKEEAASVPPVVPSKPKDHDDPPWLKAAYAELGVAEIPGAPANPRIVQFHESTTLDKELAKTDETPWCASFIEFCLSQSGRSGTKSAWARSYSSYGDPLDIPRRGCIAVFTRGHSSGHVAFFLKEIDGKILCLGGNQNNRVCEAFYPKVRLIGYRWPKGRL